MLTVRSEHVRNTPQPLGEIPGNDPMGLIPVAGLDLPGCPDARIMKAADGSFHYAYSAQAIVDADHQVIVAMTLTSNFPL